MPFVCLILLLGCAFVFASIVIYPKPLLRAVQVGWAGASVMPLCIFGIVAFTAVLARLIISGFGDEGRRQDRTRRIG